MSNKPHLHPHQEKRHASEITRLLIAILVLAIFALVIALEVTGRVEFRGRLILLRGVGCVEVPHPIAAGNRLEGRDCQGWRLRHRVSDSEAALYWPVLEGYTIGSG